MTRRKRRGRGVLESAFQAEVVKRATVLGWDTMHVNPAVVGGRTITPTTHKGWPDLTLWKGDRLIFAELKKADGVPTPEQAETVRRLGRIRTVRAEVWKPEDMQAITEILARRV